MVAKPVFDDAIFQRMKADYRQTPAWTQGCESRLQPSGQLTEFIIDVNTNRLKRARRRMLFLEAALWDGSSNHISQLASGPQRARSNNRPGNALRKALLAIVPQHPHNIFLHRAIEPLRSAHAALRIHTHVQRTIVTETEAALRHV